MLLQAARGHSLSHAQTLQIVKFMGNINMGLFTKSQETSIWKLPVKPGRQRKYALTPQGSDSGKYDFFCDISFFFFKT